MRVAHAGGSCHSQVCQDILSILAGILYLGNMQVVGGEGVEHVCEAKGLLQGTQFTCFTRTKVQILTQHSSSKTPTLASPPSSPASSTCPYSNSKVSALALSAAHTSAYVSIRQHPSAYVSIRECESTLCCALAQPNTYVPYVGIN
jgi:hypothetical protein